MAASRATQCASGISLVSHALFVLLTVVVRFALGQALLTYWGLAHPQYEQLDVVTTVRKALCKQMGSLFLSQWRRHGHVCENFSPWKNATECTGMHFYHWGALAGFIGLLEAGYY